MRAIITATAFATLAFAASASPVGAGVPNDPWAIDWARKTVADDTGTLSPLWKVHFSAEDRAERLSGGLRLAAVSMDAQAAAVSAQAGSARPRAFEYSDAYETRRKIHVYASVATLPLFVTEVILGQKLYNGTSPNDSVRSAHRVVAGGIAALFGVNTVTGVWNLWEGRKDPNRRTLRIVHGLLMLGSDAGFVATGILAPNHHGGGNWSLHRSVALTSIGVATAGYLMMLLAR